MSRLRFCSRSLAAFAATIVATATDAAAGTSSGNCDSLYSTNSSRWWIAVTLTRGAPECVDTVALDRAPVAAANVVIAAFARPVAVVRVTGLARPVVAGLVAVLTAGWVAVAAFLLIRSPDAFPPATSCAFDCAFVARPRAVRIVVPPRLPWLFVFPPAGHRLGRSRVVWVAVWRTIISPPAAAAATAVPAERIPPVVMAICTRRQGQR